MEILVVKAKALPPEGQREVLDFVEFLETRLGRGTPHKRPVRAHWLTWATTGNPLCGHSWPANRGQSWIQAHTTGGGAAGTNLVQNGGRSGTAVGSGGGYGGIYCFSLQP